MRGSVATLVHPDRVTNQQFSLVIPAALHQDTCQSHLMAGDTEMVGGSYPWLNSQRLAVQTFCHVELLHDQEGLCCASEGGRVHRMRRSVGPPHDVEPLVQELLRLL